MTIGHVGHSRLCQRPVCSFSRVTISVQCSNSDPLANMNEPNTTMPKTWSVLGRLYIDIYIYIAKSLSTHENAHPNTSKHKYYV